MKTAIFDANTNIDVSENLSEAPSLEPEDIAESIVYVLGTPQRVQITELTIRPLNEIF